MKAIDFALVACGVLLCSTTALAAPAWQPTGKSIRWTSQTVTTEKFDCSKAGGDGIVVSGTVRVVHPNPSASDPQTISIDCDNLRFEDSAEIVTVENLKIRIFKQIAGPVRLLNVRGTKGPDATPTPELWEVRKARSGGNGGSGGSGRDAETSLKGDWSAEDGGGGHRGENGEHGKNGTTGAHGSGGQFAGKLLLKVGTEGFADGSGVFMSAPGGAGGVGGKGERGVDGGDGGRGGNGGKGGNANPIHGAGSGGNGGNGGDGGDGGNGGQGGNGGPGGNGGDVWLYMLHGGGQPVDSELEAPGGKGGAPGEGGDPGLGGAGGDGGSAGCGGSGSRAGGWQFHGDGGCGTDGVRGRRGRDGRKGPPGVWGEDGKPGHIGRIGMGYIKPEDF
jgi:hypothetical protein